MGIAQQTDHHFLAPSLTGKLPDEIFESGTASFDKGTPVKIIAAPVQGRPEDISMCSEAGGNADTGHLDTGAAQFALFNHCLLRRVLSSQKSSEKPA